MEASSNLPAAAGAAAGQRAATSAQAAFRDQLLGPQKGQMNLAALRARAEELRRSIDRVVHTLQFAADRVQWADVLDEFAVLNVQFQYLWDQLRPLLKHWVVHPRSVNQSNAHTLPIMLAIKLLPEMEAENGALLEEQLQQLVGGDAAAQLLAVGEQTEAFNNVLDALTRHSQQARGLLDPKGPRMKELGAAAARVAAAAAAGGGAAQAQAQRPPAPGVRAAPPGAPAGPGGQRRLEGPELLLAAVGFGAGLEPGAGP